MAPKKKEDKAKTKKKNKSEISPKERERLDLLQKASLCSSEASAEKVLEHQFTQQSEGLKQYWELEKSTRSGKKRILLQKEQRLKELNDRHVITLGEYKQTIKDKLFSNQDELSKNVTESLLNVHSTTSRHQHEAGLQENDLHEISARIDTTIRSHEDFKTAMLQWRNDMTTDLREQATRRIAAVASYSEKQFKSTRELYNGQLKEELKDLELDHDCRISNAIEQNKQNFHDIRKHCNMTINDNLDLITSLRNEVSELRDQDRCTKKVLNEMHSENENIIVPLENKKQSLEQLNSDLDAYNDQKRQLNAQKQQLKRAEGELKEIEWDHEVLFQKLEALQKDHGTQKRVFNHSIYTAQQQSNYQNLILEQRIQKLSKDGNKNTAAIIGILQRANIGLDTIQHSKVPITDVVTEKNSHLQSLQEQLKNITNAHSHLLDKFETLKATVKS